MHIYNNAFDTTDALCDNIQQEKKVVTDSITA